MLMTPPTAYRRLYCLAASVALATVVIAGSGCAKDPDTAKRAFVASGDAYLAHGKTAEAIIEYRNAIQQDPAFAEARLKLSDAYLRAGDRAGAIGELIRAADLLPEDGALQIRAGRQLLLAGQYDTARARAEKALAIDPKNVDALVLRANALAGLRDLDGAVTEIEAALAVDPTLLSGYTTLGAVQMVRGQRDEAEAAFKKAVETAPHSAEAHLALANYYLAVRQAAGAETELKAVLAIDPAHTLAARALAYFYVGSGRAELAEPYLKTVADHGRTDDGKLALAAYYLSRRRQADAKQILEALATGGRDGATAARLQLATLAFGSGDTATATRLVDEVLAKEPSNTRALAARAELLASAGRLDDALAAARKASESDGRSALAQYALGKVRVLRHEEREALVAFNEALRLNSRLTPAKVEAAKLLLSAGRLTEAESHARSVQTDVPESPAARLLVARVQLARGEVTAAEPEIRRLARALPADPDVQTTAGLLELRRGNRAAARAAFERAVSARPAQLEAVRNLVALDVAERKLDAARARVDALLSSRSNDPDVALMASGAMAAIGDRARAEQLARGVIDAHPDNLEAYVMLGRLYLAEKRLTEATAQYQALADRQPNSVPAHTVVGLLLEMQNKRAEARARYERILQIDPTASVAANNLAWMHVEDGGNLDVALKLAQTAQAKLPDQPEVNDTIGWIYYKKGLYDLAIPPLAQAAGRSPDNVSYQYHLGAAYAGKGETEKARAALTKSLAGGSLAPADAAHARQLLEAGR